VADTVIVDALTGKVTERSFTPAEAAQRAADAQAYAAQQAILDALHTNRSTLEAQATAALAQNRTAIAANPATVTLAQVAGQVQALSAQNNALIRLVLGLLDGVN
jgi:multidrug resistance efflux pump